MLVHLPREEGYGTIEPYKNGPALAGYGALTMKDVLAAEMATLPEQLRRSLTWDRGKELPSTSTSRWRPAFPCSSPIPQPWQRGTNENTNGLFRQYFPKGTDLSRWSTKTSKRSLTPSTRRPRKTLGWKTPAEAFERAPTISATNRCCFRPVEIAQFTSWGFTENVRNDAPHGLDGHRRRLLRQRPDGAFWGSMQIELLNRRSGGPRSSCPSPWPNRSSTSTTPSVSTAPSATFHRWSSRSST